MAILEGNQHLLWPIQIQMSETFNLPRWTMAITTMTSIKNNDYNYNTITTGGKG